MSPEKLQLLLAQLDKVRLAAVEAAKACGMPDRVLAPFFMRPMHSADWMLELAKEQARNPGLLNFMTEHMPEMQPARLQGALHRGPESVPKGQGPNAKANKAKGSRGAKAA